jgi:hypothetical protein
MIDQYSEQPRNKIAKHKADRNQAVRDYITEHGPTPRRIAIKGIARRYWTDYTNGRSVAIGMTQMRMVEHMAVMEREGTLIRGPRPEQILTLPKG